METRRPKSSSHKRSNIKPRKNKPHTHRRTKSQNTPPNHHHHHPHHFKKNGSASNNNTTTSSGGIQKNNNNNSNTHFKSGKNNNNNKHHKKFPKKNFKKMDVERVPIVTKKIDYAVIARLLGLDQLNPGDKLSLANVRLDSASLDTGSIPQLEGLLDLFKKHKIAEPESLMNSVSTLTSTGGDGKVQFQPSILGDFLNSCVQNNIIQNNNPLGTTTTTTAASTPQSISITLPTSGSLPAIPQYTDSLPTTPLHTTSSLPTISIPSISSSGLPPLATSDLTMTLPLNTSVEIFRDSVNQFQQNWYGSFSRNISHKVSQNGKMVLLSNRRLTRRKK